MNDFWDALYDAFEAGVDETRDWLRGHTTYEAMGRADDREDRAMLRAGHDPDVVAERREAIYAQARADHAYEIDVGDLKHGLGWYRDEIETVLNEHDELTTQDLITQGARPTDFGFVRGQLLEASRGSLSLMPDDASSALSFPPGETDAAPSLADREKNVADLDLG